MSYMALRAPGSNDSGPLEDTLADIGGLEGPPILFLAFEVDGIVNLVGSSGLTQSNIPSP